jgi:DNA polymerase-3 subunit beta
LGRGLASVGGQVERGEGELSENPADHREQPGLGEAKDDLEVAYRGPSLTIGFNARYILDVLSALETDEVILELGDEHSPGVLHAPGDKAYTAVVMPMRV